MVDKQSHFVVRVYRTYQQHFLGLTAAVFVSFTLITTFFVMVKLDETSTLGTPFIVYILCAHLLALCLLVGLIIVGTRHGILQWSWRPRKGVFQTVLIAFSMAAITLWSGIEAVRAYQSQDHRKHESTAKHYTEVAGFVTNLVEIMVEFWILSFFKCNKAFRYIVCHFSSIDKQSALQQSSYTCIQILGFIECSVGDT
jgi:hypothetical protein